MAARRGETSVGLWIAVGVHAILLVLASTSGPTAWVAAILVPPVLTLLILLLSLPDRDRGTRDWFGLILVSPYLTLASGAAALPRLFPVQAGLLGGCFLGVATALLSVGLIIEPRSRVAGWLLLTAGVLSASAYPVSVHGLPVLADQLAAAGRFGVLLSAVLMATGWSGAVEPSAGSTKREPAARRSEEVLP